MIGGTYHIFTGILRRTTLGYVLEMEDGGHCRLHIMYPDENLIDRPVIAEVTSSNLALFDVHWIGHGQPACPDKKERKQL